MKKAYKFCTSIEQSRKLVKLGLDVNTADMYYYTVNGDLYETPNIIESEDDLCVDENSIPCWSITALLELMPELDGRNPTLNRIINTNKWWMMYHSTATLPLIRTHEHNIPTDAAYEMTCILIKDKKL